MDEADKASRLETLERDCSLREQQARAHRHDAAAQLVIDGVVCCIDCQEPIDPQRLAARPQAVRCIDCERRLEKRQQGY